MTGMRHVVALAATLSAAVGAAGATVYSVAVNKGRNAGESGIAISVAEGVLLASYGLVGRSDQCLVTDPDTSAQLIATVTVGDARQDLALLAVSGFASEPAAVALDAPTAGRSARVPSPGGSHREGALQSVEELPDGRTAYRYALVDGPDQVSAPVLNNCDELVGIGFFRQQEKNLWSSGSLPAVKQFLASNGVEYKAATEACLPLGEQLAGELEEANSRLAEAEAAKTEIHKKRTAIEAEKEKVTEEKTALEARLNELEKATSDDKKQAEEEKARIQAEIQTLETRQSGLEDSLESRRQEVAARQKEIDGLTRTKASLEEQLLSLEEERRAESERYEGMLRAQGEVVRVQQIVGIGLGVLLLAGIAFGVSQRRARRRERSESEQRLASAREDLERSSATFSDVMLSGTGPDGQEVRLKINGTAVARSQDGQVIGRSSADADYVIAVDSVSRRHARLFLRDGELMVEDLRSLNGTSVDGIKLEPGSARGIGPGARVTLGDVELGANFLGNGRA